MKPSRVLLTGALLLGACNLNGPSQPADCKTCTAKGATPSAPGTAPAAADVPGGAVDLPAHAPVLGPAAATVTVVLFTSYPCPGCGPSGILGALVDTYPGRVRAAVRMAPPPGDADARLAAEAALAAHAQGKFWDVHARLSAPAEGGLARAQIDQVAKEAGLDMDRFKADLDGHRFAPAVDQDVAAIDVPERPTYRVNARTMQGEQARQDLESAIEVEFKRADALAAGVYPPATARPMLEAPPPPPRPLDTAVARQLVAAGAPSRGPANAPVTLTVFSNFAIPYARNVAATLKKVQALHGSKLRLVFHVLALEGADEGQVAARAALAAHQQGRFWEMHDLLFFSGAPQDRDAVLRHARALKLSEDRFLADMESPRVKAALAADMADARTLGVRSVPTVYVNEEALLGDQALDNYEALVTVRLGGSGATRGGGPSQ